MGLFDKLKGSVGIGQPNLSVTLENNQVHRGTSIKGKIKLTAQDRDVPVNNIEIVFTQVIKESVLNEKKKIHEIKSHPVKLAKKEIAKGGQLLKAGQSTSDDFMIDISSEAPPTAQLVSYTLHISVDMGGLDASETLEIFVV
jgi:sporulation-control protein spo0M